MAKGTRNNRPRAVSNEGSQTGSVTVEQVDAKIESLNQKFDILLLIVKDVLNMTGKVASEVMHSVNSREIVDADKNSTQAVPERNFKLDVAIVEEFHSLKQSSDVAFYQESFEKLREVLVAMNYGFTEDYFIYSFLSGLKEEIRCLVWETKPETLVHAYNLARIHEIAFELKKEKLTSPEMRIAGEDTSRYDSMVVYGTYDPHQTMRGYAGKRALSFIWSINNKYSLLDVKTAIVAGCKIEETEPLLVRFALSGSQTVSRFKTRFQFKIHGHEFEADMRIVDLALDMLLGRDWLINYDFEFQCGEEKAYFVKEGKRYAMPF